VIDGIETWNEPDARAYSRFYADRADLTTVYRRHRLRGAKLSTRTSPKRLRTSSKRELYSQIGFVPEIAVAWKMTGALDWDKYDYSGSRGAACGGVRGNPAAPAVI
jgi:hypothetical protein